MGIIYSAYNKITGKSYIGLTKRTLKKRINCHYYDAKRTNSKSRFHNALNKYSKDSFEWKILMNNVENEELPMFEKMFISLFDTINNGYNMSKGGVGFNGNHRTSSINKMKLSKLGKKSIETRKDIMMFNYQTGEMITHFKGIIEASKYTNIIETSITNNLKKRSNFCRNKKTKEKVYFSYKK
jgi:hypothetical protein